MAYVLMLGMLIRALQWRAAWEALIAAAKTTVMIFLLIGFGSILTEFFTLTQAPQQVVDLVAQFALPKWATITCIILVLAVLGMFLESLSMLLVTVPTLYPLMLNLNVEPLAFGVFMVLAVEMALITPPIGMNLFTVCTIAKIDFVKVSRAVVPYIACMVTVMYLVVYFPSIATMLPQSMK